MIKFWGVLQPNFFGWFCCISIYLFLLCWLKEWRVYCGEWPWQYCMVQHYWGCHHHYTATTRQPHQPTVSIWQPPAPHPTSNSWWHFTPGHTKWRVINSEATFIVTNVRVLQAANSQTLGQLLCMCTVTFNDHLIVGLLHNLLDQQTFSMTWLAFTLLFVYHHYILHLLSSFSFSLPSFPRLR